MRELTGRDEMERAEMVEREVVEVKREAPAGMTLGEVLYRVLVGRGAELFVPSTLS